MEPCFKPYDLSYIVDAVKTDLDIAHTRHDLRFYKWAVDTFREMNEFGVLPTYKSIRLKVDKSDNSITFPHDYEEYTKVGIDNNGYILNLSLNKNLVIAPPRLDCCLETINETVNISSQELGGLPYYSTGSWWDYQWFYLPSWHNGQFVAGRYGRGEGFNRGAYRVDGRKMYFDKVLPVDVVILEYKSNGDIADGNAYLPSFAIKGLVSGVHKLRCLHSKNPVEKNDYRIHTRRYTMAIKQIVAQINALSPFQILDIVRSSIHQLPKR